MRIAAFLLVLTTWLSVAIAQPKPSPPASLYYVVTTPVELRERPDAGAKLLGTASPLDYLAVQKRLKDGWFAFKMRRPGAGPLDVLLEPEKATFDVFARAASIDNYIVADPGDAVRIRDKIARTTWPDEIKSDVAKKRVQVGFTEEQVLLAVGEPSQREGETWMYSKTMTMTRAGKAFDVLEHRITFEGGKVKTVNRKESPARALP